MYHTIKPPTHFSLPELPDSHCYPSTLARTIVQLFTRTDGNRKKSLINVKMLIILVAVTGRSVSQKISSKGNEEKQNDF